MKNEIDEYAEKPEEVLDELDLLELEEMEKESEEIDLKKTIKAHGTASEEVDENITEKMIKKATSDKEVMDEADRIKAIEKAEEKEKHGDKLKEKLKKEMFRLFQQWLSSVIVMATSVLVLEKQKKHCLQEIRQ